jgi:uncharacterized protein YbcV (DUF1398 family)
MRRVINTNVIREVLAESQAWDLTFPWGRKRHLEAGVESYFGNAVKGEDTFYMLDGETHVEKISPSLEQVAEEVSSPRTVSAIRAAQADTIRYPEFMKRAAAAGVIGYWAFLTGKKVIYFGRKGKFQVEEFPVPKV